MPLNERKQGHKTDLIHHNTHEKKLSHEYGLVQTIRIHPLNLYTVSFSTGVNEVDRILADDL